MKSRRRQALLLGGIVLSLVVVFAVDVKTHKVTQIGIPNLAFCE